MPTIYRYKSYRFFFYSNENNEPVHVHVQDGRKLAKYWLLPVILAKNTGFNRHELNMLQQIINIKQKLFVGKWYEFFY